MKISLIIPHVPTKELDEMLDNCLKRLTGYDELVLIINDGIGYGKAFNWGFKAARGEYLLAVSNDAFLTEGTIEMMCDPKAVTMSQNAQWGCFFCLPRWVYEKIGGFDERFEGAYFEDNDYIGRLRQANIPILRIKGVIVEHKGGETIHAIGNETELMNINRAKFVAKWGFEPIQNPDFCL